MVELRQRNGNVPNGFSDLNGNKEKLELASKPKSKPAQQTSIWIALGLFHYFSGILNVVRSITLKPILFLAWKVIHLVYVFIFTVNIQQVVKAWWASLKPEKKAKHDLKVLLTTDKFQKLAKHLVIAIHDNNDSLHNLEQMVRLIGWAWVSNIKVVTLYEPLGILKSQAQRLKPMVEASLKKICQDLKEAGVEGPKTIPPTIIIHNSGAAELEEQNDATMEKIDNEILDRENQNTENGRPISDVLPIYLYCDKDGKPAITQAAKQILHEKNNAKPAHSVPEAILNREVEMGTFNATLDKAIAWKSSQNSDIPSEPEQMMVCGKIRSTIGYLPWHIRLTEIHWLPEVHLLQLSDFWASLQKYAKCEQRVGT